MPKKSYQQLKTELEEIVEWFEASPPDLDEALQKYEQAQKCLTELQDYLSQATLKIRKIEQSKRSQ